MLDLIALGIATVPAVGSLAHRLWVRLYRAPVKATASTMLSLKPLEAVPEGVKPPPAEPGPVDAVKPTPGNSS